MNRESEVSRFTAKTDSGKIYIIIEYQEYISTASLPNPNAEMPGLKRWATPNRLAVNQIDAETFQIVQTNEIVRKF